MKLLICFACSEVRSLNYTKTMCKCGQTWGMYLTEEHAEFGGNGCLIGLSNTGLFRAVMKYKGDHEGSEVKAFVIGDDSTHVKRILAM